MNKLLGFPILLLLFTASIFAQDTISAEIVEQTLQTTKIPTTGKEAVTAVMPNAGFTLYGLGAVSWACSACSLLPSFSAPIGR